jgi:hypothetical protein
MKTEANVFPGLPAAKDIVNRFWKVFDSQECIQLSVPLFLLFITPLSIAIYIVKHRLYIFVS